MSHTPGPWRVEYDSRGYPAQIVSLDGGAYNPVTRFGTTFITPAIPAGRANANLMAASPTVLDALVGMLDNYTALVNSGDAGHWDPEKEPPVIAARAAIKLATEGADK